MKELYLKFPFNIICKIYFVTRSIKETPEIDLFGIVVLEEVFLSFLRKLSTFASFLSAFVVGVFGADSFLLMLGVFRSDAFFSKVGVFESYLRSAI